MHYYPNTRPRSRIRFSRTPSVTFFPPSLSSLRSPLSFNQVYFTPISLRPANLAERTPTMNHRRLKSGHRGTSASTEDQNVTDFGSASSGGVVHAQPMRAARDKKGVTVPSVPSYITSAFRGLYKVSTLHAGSTATAFVFLTPLRRKYRSIAGAVSF